MSKGTTPSPTRPSPKAHKAGGLPAVLCFVRGISRPRCGRSPGPCGGSPAPSCASPRTLRHLPALEKSETSERSWPAPDVLLCFVFLGENHPRCRCVARIDRTKACITWECPTNWRGHSLPCCLVKSTTRGNKPALCAHDICSRLGCGKNAELQDFLKGYIPNKSCEMRFLLPGLGPPEERLE